MTESSLVRKDQILVRGTAQRETPHATYLLAEIIETENCNSYVGRINHDALYEVRNKMGLLEQPYLNDLRTR